MSYTQVLSQLKAMGTAQNRKVYARHGVGKNMYGVSYANLGKLKKQIKTDHELARKLWASKNHDARVLATMVADPKQTPGSLLEGWVRELDNYVITEAVAGFASRTVHAESKMKKWKQSKQEWIGSAGWGLVTTAALGDNDVPDRFFEECLETIEAEIHKAKNRVRHAMNGALIAIGMRNARLEKSAVAAAGRIGKVEVDHGETGCKTPDAVAYIRKAKSRRKKR